MRVGILGINHKLAEVNLREALGRACQRRFGPENSTHGAQQFVLLSTCNRTELYFSSEDLASTHTYILNILRREIGEDFDQKIYSYFGCDCFSHLARVASGLDSAIVAETEIQGQVRIAYEQAMRCSHLPFEMHYLFQKCLKIGKKIRERYPLKPGLPGIEHALLNVGKHYFDEVHNRKVLFVGASNINKKIISSFCQWQLKNLYICNRTSAKAREIAAQYQIQSLSWDYLHSWSSFDWVIFGTKSPECLIHRSHAPASLDSKKLLIDLCVPRNVDPLLSRQKGVALLNVDQLNRTLKIRRQQMNQTLVQAETFVAESAQCQLDIFKRKESKRKAMSECFCQAGIAG